MQAGAAVIPLRWRLALAGALALASLPASAQGPRESRGAPAGQFDFYILTLSWSPGFCEASGEVRGRSQCDPGRQLGFVVHGLWPQNEAGYPSFCEPGSRFPSRPALDEAKGLFPDEGLARYQWRKHGTCTGLSPADYYRATRHARDLVQIPASLDKPSADARVLPLEVERAFSQINPSLRPDMIAVECGRRVLQGVRICLNRDLRGFRSCPQVDRDGCRAGEITVNGVR
jgi:ribonuclease T2